MKGLDQMLTSHMERPRIRLLGQQQESHEPKGAPRFKGSRARRSNAQQQGRPCKSGRKVEGLRPLLPSWKFLDRTEIEDFATDWSREQLGQINTERSPRKAASKPIGRRKGAGEIIGYR
jgi:hypothetical protein